MELNWLTIGSLVNLSTSFILGTFVFFKNRKGGINKTFALMSFFVAFWAYGLFIYCSPGIDKETALFWARVCNLAAIFIPVAYLHFILEFIDLAEKRKLFVKSCYILSSVLFLSSMIFPNQFVGDVRTKVPGLPNTFYADKPGVLYHIFTLSFTAYVLYFLLLMFNAWKKSSGIKRNQLKYNIVATIVGFGGGGTTFLLVYNIPFTPYPNILMNLWTVILAVAIIRYKLFEIDTVIHRTALWLITSFWLVIPAYFLFKLTRYWLQSLSTFWLTISSLGLFYLFLGYYRYFQPKIDHLFRRRKYDYQVILSKVAEKTATTINIKDLTCQLLDQVCEAMYLRNGLLYLLDKDGIKYTLIGRRRYNEVELFNEEETAPLNYDREIPTGSPLFKWLLKSHEVLEKDQIEANPEFKEIKDEALKLFTDNALEVIIPLVLENKVNALLGLGKKENLKAYTLKDIALLKKLGQETGVTIYNALHYRDLLEKDRLEEEIRLGRDIQMNLLPKELPNISNLSISGLMLPAKEIGGDYYDFISLPRQDELAIAIADVSGKGVAAGIIMATAKATLKGLSQQNLSPKQILSQTNNLIYEYTNGQKFITMLYFQYKPKDRTIAYSSAGHEHILIYHAKTGTVEAIMSGGFMLGMLQNIDSYLEEHSITLGVGEKILLYTDGVTDAENQKGERFGLERLKESFKTNSTKAPVNMIQAVKDEVYSFIGTQPQYDDITLVGMEAK